LIDGLQRISTVLEFMGVLRDPDTNELRRSKLSKTKYLDSLEGIVWLATRPEEESLDKALQLFFRRHRIDFQILKHPSDPKTKYDLFQRLNRGGEVANEQEVRTCAMVLANPEFTQRLKLLVAQEDFKKIFRITDEQRDQQKDVEYGVRLIVHTYKEISKDKDVGEFFDQAIIDVMTEKDIDSVLDNAAWVVALLYRLYGEQALIPPAERMEGIAARFSLRALEGIAVGLARNKDPILAKKNPDSFIRKRVAEFWRQQAVADMSTPGLRGTIRIQRSVPFGATWFNPNA
jgi:hypothetical protein